MEYSDLKVIMDENILLMEEGPPPYMCSVSTQTEHIPHRCREPETLEPAISEIYRACCPYGIAVIGFIVLTQILLCATWCQKGCYDPRQV